MINYQLLGRTGLRVADICLGTMTFGEEWGWGSSKEEARKIYDYYREQGGNFIDTANVYTNGTSETFLGEFMAGHRREVVLATKYTNVGGETKNPNAGGNHRKSMMESVEASLKRLQTDYIDLYWMHIWDQMTPVEEVMRAFDDLVRQGKVLYIGISDAPAWWVAKANTLAELRGWTYFAGLQIEYSLIERTPERELIPMAKEFGLTVTAWSPLAGGILTGKYVDGKPHEGGRMSVPAMSAFRKDKADEDRIVGAVISLAKKKGASPAQIALAWLRYASVPTIPIIGAKKMSQLEDNLASSEVELDKEELKLLNEASAIKLGFPQDFYDLPMAHTFLYGGLRDRIKA